jgi:hypothetical protein
MAETTAPREVTPAVLPARPAGGRLKFIIGGGVLLAAVGVLLVATIMGGQETFTTVEDLTARSAELAGRSCASQARLTDPLLSTIPRRCKFDIVARTGSATKQPGEAPTPRWKTPIQPAFTS